MASAETSADADDAIKVAKEALAISRMAGVSSCSFNLICHSNENESSHHQIKSAKAPCRRIWRLSFTSYALTAATSAWMSGLTYLWWPVWKRTLEEAERSCLSISKTKCGACVQGREIRSRLGSGVGCHDPGDKKHYGQQLFPWSCSNCR